jgi:hypothetical protein
MNNQVGEWKKTAGIDTPSVSKRLIRKEIDWLFIHQIILWKI